MSAELVVLSAPTADALTARRSALVQQLQRGGHSLAAVAAALQQQPAGPHRLALACADAADAAAVLDTGDRARLAQGEAAESAGVAFMFPGLGEQYPNLGRVLYDTEAVFRDTLDACAERVRTWLGFDLREALFDDEAAAATAAPDLRAMMRGATPPAPKGPMTRTLVAHPTVFSVEWAAAALLKSWGIVPTAVFGHSLGSYTAAVAAGVLELDDALSLVCTRARLIQGLPRSAMAAVALGEDELKPWLTGELDLAATHSAHMSVVAGRTRDVVKLEKALGAKGIAARRVAARHGFHSRQLDPACAPYAAEVRQVEQRAPGLPMVCSVTGRWLPDQPPDADYWVRHMVATVRFREALDTLFEDPHTAVLEVGPGQALTAFARMHPRCGAERLVRVGPSMPEVARRGADREVLLAAVGRLWVRGVQPDWDAMRRDAVELAPLDAGVTA